MPERLPIYLSLKINNLEFQLIVTNDTDRHGARVTWREITRNAITILSGQFITIEN